MIGQRIESKTFENRIKKPSGQDRTSWKMLGSDPIPTSFQSHPPTPSAHFSSGDLAGRVWVGSQGEVLRTARGNFWNLDTHHWISELFFRRKFAECHKGTRNTRKRSKIFSIMLFILHRQVCAGQVAFKQTQRHAFEDQVVRLSNGGALLSSVSKYGWH